MILACFALVMLLVACYQSTVQGAEIVTNFTSSVWSNVRSDEMIAYLNTAAVGTVDVCSSVPTPTNSKNWILMLEGFDTCPLNKIAHAREAGYVMLFVFNRGNINSYISDTVEATAFPVVIISEKNAANLLQESANYYPGKVYAKISRNDTTTLLQIIIYADDTAERVTTTSATVGDFQLSKRLNHGEIVGISFAVVVLILVFVIIAVVLGVLVIRHREKVIQGPGSNSVCNEESNDMFGDKKELIQQD